MNITKAYNANSKVAEFWRRFCECCCGCLVLRVGYPIFNYHKDVPMICSPDDRPESDAEHSYLFMACIMLCRKIFKIGSISAEEACRQYELAIVHDLPEYESGGDPPDDGSRDEDAKNKKEYDYICWFSDCFEPEDRDMLRNDMKEFQLKYDFSFLMDKLEYILKQLWLCSHGILGATDFKKDLSASDEYYMDQTGEWLAAINTAAKFLDVTKDKCNKEERDLCIRLIEEGFMQAFHAIPAALEQFY